jgi:hypothetical protein
MATEGGCRLIILQGRAGAGKDTVADMIERHTKGRVARVSLADPLRAASLRILRILTDRGDAEWFIDRELKEAVLDRKPHGSPYSDPWVSGEDPNALFNKVELTPRVILRAVATIMRDEVGPGVWRDAAVEKMKKAVAEGAQTVVVTDARFPTEKDPEFRERVREEVGFDNVELWWIVLPEGVEPTEEEIAALPPTERDSHTGKPERMIINDKERGMDQLSSAVALHLHDEPRSVGESLTALEVMSRKAALTETKRFDLPAENV